ncbi:hypothetical protein FHU36_001045 [Nonomuraea muscovyensis]|uniref:Uncharacterized protein n=1 Tax=Nonomuraea muscovyensis TaxID=1124761 RepID=A0A7X0BYK9_9ACTN|nr:hypothetical protein [Nonomuraea muscovyensis]
MRRPDRAADRTRAAGRSAGTGNRRSCRSV